MYYIIFVKLKGRTYVFTNKRGNEIARDVDWRPVRKGGVIEDGYHQHYK